MVCSLLGCVDCAAAQSAPQTGAEAFILMDAGSGRVLTGKNTEQELAIASTTKIMTALVALETGNLSDKVTVKQNHLKVGSSMYLRASEVLTLEELLYGLLLPSGNDAAECIADHCGGGVERFVARMNEKAAALGMTHTSFANPSGLDAQGHYSCALDMARLAAYAMREPTFARIAATRTAAVGERMLGNHNKLLASLEGCTGLKTGYTDEAGRCLLASAIKDGRRLISVVLGCTTKEVNGETRLMNFVDSATLLDWGYNNFTVQTVFTKDDLIQEIPVLLSKETNAVLVHTAEDVNILLPNDVTTDMLERKVTVYGDTAFAPIEAGQELGEMTLSYDGYDYATVKLLAADSVSVNRFLQGKYLLSQFFSKPLVKILTVVVILLVLAVVVWVRMLRPKSRYGSRGRRNRGTRNYRGRRR